VLESSGCFVRPAQIRSNTSAILTIQPRCAVSGSGVDPLAPRPQDSVSKLETRAARPLLNSVHPVRGNRCCCTVWARAPPCCQLIHWSQPRCLWPAVAHDGRTRLGLHTTVCTERLHRLALPAQQRRQRLYVPRAPEPQLLRWTGAACRPSSPAGPEGQLTADAGLASIVPVLHSTTASQGAMTPCSHSSVVGRLWPAECKALASAAASICNCRTVRAALRPAYSHLARPAYSHHRRAGPRQELGKKPAFPLRGVHCVPVQKEHLTKAAVCAPHARVSLAAASWPRVWTAITSSEPPNTLTGKTSPTSPSICSRLDASRAGRIQARALCLTAPPPRTARRPRSKGIWWLPDAGTRESGTSELLLTAASARATPPHRAGAVGRGEVSALHISYQDPHQLCFMPPVNRFAPPLLAPFVERPRGARP
jgi:hypothetical protein